MVSLALRVIRRRRCCGACQLEALGCLPCRVFSQRDVIPRIRHLSREWPARQPSKPLRLGAATYEVPRRRKEQRQPRKKKSCTNIRPNTDRRALRLHGAANDEQRTLRAGPIRTPHPGADRSRRLRRCPCQCATAALERGLHTVPTGDGDYLIIRTRLALFSSGRADATRAPSLGEGLSHSPRRWTPLISHNPPSSGCFWPDVGHREQGGLFQLPG